MRKGTPMSRRHATGLLLGASGALLTGCEPTQDKGMAASADSGRWHTLQSEIKGQLHTADSGSYEHTRRSMIWSARKAERFPAGIVRAANASDVAYAVQFAQKHGLKVAVRGGGHHWSQSALRDGSVLIDLSGLDRVEVDVAQRTCVAQPGINARAFSTRLAPHRLAFPVGHCPSVPLSGFLLSGGIGWNIGVWGPSCASVQGIDMVDARGELLYVDARQNADLFWAARGAGPGFFGIVTGYHLTLPPLPRAIRTSTIVYAAHETAAVATLLGEALRTMPPQVELTCAMFSDKIVVQGTAFADTESRARDWLAPLAKGRGTDILQETLLRDTPFSALFEDMDSLFPASHRYAGDAVWSGASPGLLLGALREYAMAAPSEHSFVLMAFATSPARERPPLPDMAFSMAASAFVGVYGIWTDPSQDEMGIGWTRSVARALEPHKVGHYVGECDLAASPHRARQCFSPPAWRRLAELRQQYDPARRFCAYDDAREHAR